VRAQVLVPCAGIKPIADPAFGLGGGVAGEEPFGLLAEGFVEGALDLHPRRRSDRPAREQPVAMEVGCCGGGGAVQEFHRRVGVGQDLLGPGDLPLPRLDRAGADSGAGRSFVDAGQEERIVGNQGLGCGL
jgi:hypothetical protein